MVVGVIVKIATTRPGRVGPARPVVPPRAAPFEPPPTQVPAPEELPVSAVEPVPPTEFPPPRVRPPEPPREPTAESRIAFVVTYTGYLPCDKFYSAWQSTWRYRPECLAIPITFTFSPEEVAAGMMTEEQEVGSPSPENLPVTLKQEINAPPGVQEIEIRAYVSEVVALQRDKGATRRVVAMSGDRERIKVPVTAGRTTVVAVEVRLDGTRADVILHGD